MKRIVCVGIAVLDQVFLFDRLPRDPGKHLAKDIRVIGGGMAANAAATVANLGGLGVLVSRLGDDVAGQAIVTEFSACGVDMTHVERIAGVPSSVSTVVIGEEGERMLFNFTDDALLEHAPAPDAGRFGAFDAILADGRWPAASSFALSLARERGRPGVVDLDHTLSPAWRSEILDNASYLVFSKDGLRKNTGAPDLREGIERIAQWTSAEIAVTGGSEGVFWRDGGEVRHIPAFRVHAVDTLGAGDVFHGAVALALGEGQSWPEALRFAAACAAIRCSRPGGRDAFPRRAEVERMIRQQA